MVVGEGKVVHFSRLPVDQARVPTGQTKVHVLVCLCLVIVALFRAQKIKLLSSSGMLFSAEYLLPEPESQAQEPTSFVFILSSPSSLPWFTHI